MIPSKLTANAVDTDEKSKPYCIQYKQSFQEMVQFDIIDIKPTGRKGRPVQLKNVPMEKLYSKTRPVSGQKKQDSR